MKRFTHLKTIHIIARAVFQKPVIHEAITRPIIEHRHVFKGQPRDFLIIHNLVEMRRKNKRRRLLA